MDKELSSLTAALVAVVTEQKVFVREEGVTIRSKVDKKVSVVIQPGATDGPTEITTKVGGFILILNEVIVLYLVLHIIMENGG